jgi:hypothetical protein
MLPKMYLSECHQHLISSAFGLGIHAAALSFYFYGYGYANNNLPLLYYGTELHGYNKFISPLFSKSGTI